MFHFFLWMIGFYKDKNSSIEIPKDFEYPNREEQSKDSKITWINHSSFLVETKTANFLTDPIWADQLTFIGPKRQFQPPIALENLPKVNFVIISHNHYDHLDKKTIRRLLELQKEITFIVPSGLKKWFLKHFGDVKLFELHWWEKKTIDGISFTAVPAQHFSGRTPFDRNRTLWMGCVIEAEAKRFYFVGDTGYNDYDFKKIGSSFESMDLSLIPIGTYLPRGFMKPVHVNPTEAVQIHKDVHSKLSVGGHFGTFKLSKEKMDQPPYDLFLALKKENLSWENFRILKPGQAISW